ncbi:conserved hypothetical protein [Chloroherpeton thalassium ATCC 35110]|uniref:Bacterial surface antigen (D15) domain-containing protein n=1 Tax=Chloroherpeton thalassium (strain ATCC 35110 / GB-78) TaxID=517418 RepID=B3QW52_CHLT3|nr:BamA/TamA family outer membrane protein [Chloroherpeton thalassium]ACF14706.1 conserved hypothetical protein [Chloroherpeton thalassium ATCC 35110]
MARIAYQVIFFALFLVFLINPNLAGAASPPVLPDTLPSLGTVKIAPNKHYKSQGLHTFIFGQHWRNVWTTPIEVPILDIRKFAGGLEPERKGGGFQTQSLRLKGKNGIVYKFRSVDKDPLKMMPEALQKSIVADVLQDQISSYHPLSTVLVKPFTRALGVLYSEATLCVLPNDPEILGEFNAQFGGMLGTIEIHPDEAENHSDSFAGADKVLGTHKLYEKLISDNDERVDGEAYLKARLLDLFLGDWDRHYDQWRWAGYKNGKKRIWQPIPRDRDQAFARFDGVFPWVETQVVPQMNNFSESYPGIWFLTWSGRRVDRKCLTAIDKKTWKRVAKEVQAVLTDSLIHEAIQTLPTSLQNEEAAWLEKALKSRRDHLLEAADEMYRIYAAYVDIDGSDKDDYLEIVRLENGSVAVRIYKMDKKEWEKKGKPWYSRVFDPDYTEEIRVYLHGDDDKTVISGDATESIVVRVIGGEGNDQFYDQSYVYCCGFFRSSLTYFYDSDPNTYFKSGANTEINREILSTPPDLVEKYERTPRDYGYELWYSVDNLWATYNSDFGLMLGHGARLERYKFRQSPYAYQMSIKGGYAFGSEKYELSYNADIRSFISGTSLRVEAQTTGLAMLNFYGYGNKSKINEARDEDELYETESQKTTVSTKLIIPASPYTVAFVGCDYKHLNIHFEPTLNPDDHEQTYLNLNRPKGVYENQNISLYAGFSIDTRAKNVLSSSNEEHLSFEWRAPSSPATKTAACSGYFLSLEGRYFPNALKNDIDFSKLKLDLGTYIPLPLKLSRLALRFGGEKIWGPYPFYEAAYLGGQNTLRGFRLQRYAGDAEIHAGCELRLYLSKFKFLVPISFGPLAFSETGRVFLEGERHADAWHTSVGGGLWFSFVDPSYTISISLGRTVSEASGLNTTAAYLTTGFTF